MYNEHIRSLEDIGMTITQVSEKFGLTPDTLRYYERIGMIPPVSRTTGGVRHYSEEDLLWVELARCMRSAGMPVEAIVEYVRLFREGDHTINDRLELLKTQRQALVAQRNQIDAALSRLEHKIDLYEEAVRTGVISWKKEVSKHG